MSRLPLRGAREASATAHKLNAIRNAERKATRQAYLDTLVISLLESADFRDVYASRQEAYECGVLHAVRVAKNWLEGFPND